jgi:hypothetical protein
MRHLKPIVCNCMLNSLMLKKPTRHVKNYKFTINYKIAYNCILYMVFFLLQICHSYHKT